MGCLSIKIKTIVNPIKPLVSTNTTLKPKITEIVSDFNVNVEYNKSNINPIINPIIEPINGTINFSRNFKANCSLVCKTAWVGDTKYIIVEPEYLWLANSNMFEGNVVIVSNTDWEIN